MKELIQKTLGYIGYEGEPTEKLLEEAFLDYCADGCFANLTLEEAIDMINDGEISIKTMCSNLLKVR
jgi:hypothetical protein